MKTFVCTWCSQQVNEQEVELHTTAHYAKQQNKRIINPSTTMTSISSVSYIEES